MAVNPTDSEIDQPSDAAGAGAPGVPGAGDGARARVPGSGDAPEPPEPPLPTEASQPEPGSAGDSGFFGWLRGLGVPRTPGWIGGVAAGVANRLGIDPLIVRGVLVVFALFGAPAFLAYGVAWLLLPDATGRIHLERLLRGVFDSALVGIAIFLLIGLFPPAFGVPSLFVGWPWGGDLPFNPLNPFGINLWPVLWTLLLLGGIAALVVWLVLRSRRGDDLGASGATWDASATVPTGQTGPTGPTGPTEAAGARAAVAVDSAIGAPPTPSRPAPGADSAEYEAWKVRYDQWRVANAEWRRTQADADRQARGQLHEQHRARAAAFAAQAEAARRRRRLTNPRASFAYVVATLGAALVVAALVGFGALASAATVDWAGTIAITAAALVTALSMVLAGALRRRSGFLAFTTITLLVLALVSAAPPRAEVVLGEVGGAVRTASIAQPIGDISLSLDADVAERPGTPAMQVEQGAGSIHVEVHDGTRLGLDVECGSCFISWFRVVDDTWQTVGTAQLTGGGDTPSTWHRVIGPGLEPGHDDATLAIRAGASRIEIVEYVPDLAGSESSTDPSTKEN